MTRLPSPPPRPRLSPLDVLRREWYLLRLRLWLDDYPTKKGDALVAQLRGDISDDAARRGLPAALADLGTPAELARSYADLEAPYRVRWVHGAAAMTGFWFLCGVATLLYLLGLNDGARGAAGEVTGSFLGADITVQNNDAGVGAGLTTTGVPWVLLVGLALLVLVARPWRALPVLRRRHGAAGRSPAALETGRDAAGDPFRR